jgi:hypothetical protein
VDRTGYSTFNRNGNNGVSGYNQVDVKVSKNTGDY